MVNTVASQQTMKNGLGIMVISWSLVTVNHATYDQFEHTYALVYI